VNFARSSTLFVVLGILALLFGGRANTIGFVSLFATGLGVLLGILSLCGVGRPANQPYKAPWITLALGLGVLLIVSISAISVAVRGRAQDDTPVAGGIPGAGNPAPAPFVDQINGFRLDYPGEGWKILSKVELQTLNEAAAAGAQRGPNLGGFVFVETPDPGFRIAGREREVGDQMIDQIKVDDKRVVFNRPDELDRQKAARCQVVGKLAGRGIRYEVVTLLANGRVYRLMALGPSDQSADDGLAFRPFMDAFHLLPTGPQAEPAAAPDTGRR
jgi:hypothetical protein